MKTTYSVALVIYNEDKSKYLLIRRPLDDENLPGYWGFPATSKKNPNEKWEETVKRAAKTKLGIEVEIVKLVGEGTMDRGDYMLILRDYEVKITKGKPSVPQNVKGVTQYIDLKYTNDTSELEKAAKKGSVCSRVFLKSRNINW